MSRRKFRKDDRRFLKKAGFGREFKEMGGLACALYEAQTGERPAGYVLQPDTSWGERTRRRVRRERWNRRARCVRRMLLLTLVYGGSLAVVLLLGGALWELALRLMG